MFVRALLLLLLLLSFVGSPVSAQSVLVFAGSSIVSSAVTRSGLASTSANAAALEGELNSGNHDAVVLDLSAGRPSGNWQTALSTFIAGGNGVVIVDPGLQGDAVLKAVLGVSCSNQFNDQLDLFPWTSGHHAFTQPNFLSTILSELDPGNPAGCKLSTSVGIVIGGFTFSSTAGEGAVSVTSANKVVTNSFDPRAYSGSDNNGNGIDDIVELIENELDFVLCDQTDDDGDGFTLCEGDCNDNNAQAFPLAPEVPNDGIDQDCDGADRVDLDLDTYTVDEGDCDDTDADIHPDMIESCDGVDEDCDGVIDNGTDVDDDSDGFTECEGDCNDRNPLINPNGIEEPGDGIDQNCDGLDTADVDGDGFDAGEDCDDTRDDIHPDAEEICDDTRDNDCDGRIDTTDSDCETDPGKNPDDNGTVDLNNCECSDTVGTPPLGFSMLALLLGVVVLRRAGGTQI